MSTARTRRITSSGAASGGLTLSVRSERRGRDPHRPPHVLMAPESAGDPRMPDVASAGLVGLR